MAFCIGVLTSGILWLFLSLIVMLGWNWLAPSVYGLPEGSFLQVAIAVAAIQGLISLVKPESK